jgi:hypothetical protein
MKGDREEGKLGGFLDGQRVSRAIKTVSLQYRESVENPPYFVPREES